MQTFDYNKETKTLKCALSGKMDINNSQEASKAISAKLSELSAAEGSEFLHSLKVVFDMKGVDYASSSFIRVCIFTAKQLKEGNFSMTGACEDIFKIFELAGLDKILQVS